MRSLEPRPPTVKRKGNVSLTEGDLGRRLFEKASIKTTKVDYKKKHINNYESHLHLRSSNGDVSRKDLMRQLVWSICIK